MEHWLYVGLVTVGGISLTMRAFRAVRWLNELVLAANDVPDPRTRNNAAGEKGEGDGVKAFDTHSGAPDK